MYARVEVPTERRVKRWALSMEELMSDPTGKHFSVTINREFHSTWTNSHTSFLLQQVYKNLRII